MYGLGSVDWGSIADDGLSTFFDIAHDRWGTYHPQAGEYRVMRNADGSMVEGYVLPNGQSTLGVSAMPPFGASGAIGLGTIALLGLGAIVLMTALKGH